MGDSDYNESLEEYRKQLQQVELALSVTDDDEDRKNLLTLRSDIEQLILLTGQAPAGPSEQKNIDDEYALFMSELADETAVGDNIKEELKNLEGTLCRAPHRHTWGTIVYHNALVCSILPGEEDDADVRVKVLFVNPTHKEMLPCPYFFDAECKFSDEKCRYSHGEVVPFAELEEYSAPNFSDVGVGSFVLAKCADRLWRRATVKRVYSERCVVRFDEKGDEVETELGDVLPTGAEVESETEEIAETEDVINMSLMITPASDKMGDWEKYTKGFGSKMMARMGYVVGTGLGKDARGRLDPVTAVVLPAGKSLDHCMHLRERAGGDKNLFSVERRLKRLQKRQELRNQKNYERELKKVDVFTFINNSLLTGPKTECPVVLKQTHRRQIKGESSRNLNVEALKVEDAVKSVQREIFKIQESLSRHRDPNSVINRELRRKLGLAESELGTLRSKAVNIQNEKSVRDDKKKMTVF